MSKPPRELIFDKHCRDLREFKKQYGHLAVSQGYRTESGVELGNWAHTQRQLFRKGLLADDRLRRLTKLGFEFDPGPVNTRLRWERGLSELKSFCRTQGFKNLRSNLVTENGFALGVYCRQQLHCYEDGVLPAWEKRALEQAGMKWPQSGSLLRQRIFDRDVEELAKYKRRFGDLLVPQLYATPDGTRLGQMVNRRREQFIAGELTETEIKVLERIGMVWRIRSRRVNAVRNKEEFTAWFDKGLAELAKYAKRGGLVHGQLSEERVTVRGFDLGQWFHECRRHWTSGRLSKRQIAKLEALGAVRTANDSKFLVHLDEWAAWSRERRRFMPAIDAKSPSGFRRYLFARSVNAQHESGTLSVVRRRAYDKFVGAMKRPSRR